MILNIHAAMQYTNYLNFFFAEMTVKNNVFAYFIFEITLSDVIANSAFIWFF